MPPFHFIHYLTSHLKIEESELASLIDNTVIKSVKKDEFLIKVGEICKDTFFVEKGLLRQYSIDELGKEHIISFAPENWFATDRECLFFNHPAVYFIQAIEDSEVVIIDDVFTQLLGEKIPNFTDLNLRLLHNHIRQLQHRIDLLLSTKAEKRYLQFIKTYPDILLRVPQIMVASYLGITPETLSRVRRELAEKKFQV